MGIVPPTPILLGKREAQPKDEHPLQEEWHDIELQAKFHAWNLSYAESIEEYMAMRTYVESLRDETMPYCRYLEQRHYCSSIVTNPELAEKRAQVIRMMQYGLSYSEIYMAPVAQLAEELGIPPIPRVDYRLIGEDQR